MFELLIRALKRVPRPLLPLVPMVATLLGPTLVLLLIVHNIRVPDQEENSGWAWEPRSSVARSALPAPASASQTPVVNQSITGASVSVPSQVAK